jgi:putative transposase
MELAWLKKKLTDSIEFKRSCIESRYPGVSIRRQCELLALNRSSWYASLRRETPEEDLSLMRRIDEQCLRTPFYGSRRMAACLGVNRK